MSKTTPEPLQQQIQATIYGQCVGDTLGLLTEFMFKKEAKAYYGNKPEDLKYDQKVPDFHRSRWAIGDWTDDSDQMILILHSLLYNKGEVNIIDFAHRMRFWMNQGFPELGDFGGMGIGTTISNVLRHGEFLEDPQKVAKEWMEKSAFRSASNGAVMRTSILGLHQWGDVEKVKENAITICKTTHYDPRCQASVVAVTTCIALMLQHTEQNMDVSKPKKMNVDHLIRQSYDQACQVLDTPKEKEELWRFMSCKKLKELNLCEKDKIGYTYKCMGSGFWALKKNNFKKALIKLIMEGGDADTNGSVAGAMLACKLGQDAIPSHWISDLKHKDVIDNLIEKFLKMESEMEIPLESRSNDNNDLDMDEIRTRGKQIRLDMEKKMAEERKKREEEQGAHNA